MDFSLSARQNQWIAEIESFGRATIAPLAGAADRQATMPKAVVDGCCALGLFGLGIPENYGGADVDALTFSIIIETLSRYSASVAVMIAVHNSVSAFPIVHFADDKLKQAYLPDMATGKWIGAFALTEAGAGSDCANIACTAVREGDDYRLSGSKLFITNGAQCQVAVVMAKTEPALGAKGCTLFVVDRSMGFTVSKKEQKLGMRMSDTVELTFDDVRVPSTHIIGSLNEGFKRVMENLNSSRIGIAAQAVGIAQAALDETLKQLDHRNGFRDQALAEMATHIGAARLMVYQASVLKDQGQGFAKESAMAKLLAATTCVDVCGKAIDLVGLPALRSDHALGRYFRDAKVTEIYEGTSEIQRLIIARQL